MRADDTPGVDRPTSAPALPLPAGARLVHIGPPKTGTTSLQAAFHEAREALIAQGVRYAGRSRHSAAAILAVTGRRTFTADGAPPPKARWIELRDEIRNAPEPRVVLSSEGLSYARPDAIRRVVDDLDPSRVHVVVTLRPVARLLASEWQEHTQSGLRVPFETWLEEVFADPRRGAGRGFWHRQRHDELIARWAEVVGTERATAIVLDERDPGMVLRTFEQLLGLREGTLVLVPDLANRSLTLAELAAVRALHDAFEAEGLAPWQFHNIVRMKAAAYMKQRRPAPDEPRIETPQWALDRATEIAGEIVAGIRASGVRVVGDLDSLALPQVSRLEGDALPDVLVPPEIAARMAMGILVASGVAREAAAGGPRYAEPLELARVRTRQLVGLLGRRAGARLRRLAPRGGAAR